MPENSFFQLSATLEAKEWSAFYAFACGVYAKQKVQIRLLNYVYTSRKKKKSWNNISLESAYEETFAHAMETPKQKKKLLNTLSDLHNWLLDYLIWNNIKSDKLIRTIFVAEIYRIRNLNTKFLQILTIAKQGLLKNSILDFWKSLKLMIIAHLLTYNAVVNEKRYRITELLDANKFLDEFYFLAKLRYSAAIFNHTNIEVEKAPILLLKEVREEVVKPIYKCKEHLQIYYWIGKLCEERSEEAYEILKNYFYTLSFPDKNEGLDIATFLVNHIIHHIRLGSMDLAQDCLRIFQVSLDRSLYIINGEINSTRFQNMVTLSCFFKTFDWALQFIDEYGAYLPEVEKKDAIALSYAVIFNEKRAPRKALDQLRKITSKRFNIESRRRIIQVQCFYDLEENDALIRTSCANFLTYLNRQEDIAPLIILSHKNFLKVYLKLLKSLPKKELMDLMSKMKVLAYKKWLEERIEEMMNGE